MTPDQVDAENKFLIQLVQSRFEWLKLTAEQAAAIHRYERDIENAVVAGNLASYWEEKEIEAHYFREVLSQSQFAEYKKHAETQILQHERGLADADRNVVEQIKYLSKLLAFYKDDLVPKLINHRANGMLNNKLNRNRKLEYLKEEYHQYLKVSWKEICITHFRLVKDFQPNTFQGRATQA